MEVCVDTKVAIPDNSANVKTSKSDSENKKSGDVFNSILQIKKILSSNDGESLESKLKALIAMLNKFSKKNLDFSDVNKLSGTANADNADNEISLKDISADTDEELMSMLSALINQLMTMIDNNEIAKGGSLSNLLDVSSLLDTKENKSTEKEQSTKDNIPADKSENLKNQSVDDINVNEIKDLIEKLSANLEDGKSTVKSEDTVKLQNLLKKLTEVVTNLEKQNPSKKSSDQGILNFVKPQLSMEKSKYKY